jgi:hypothetical protein
VAQSRLASGSGQSCNRLSSNCIVVGMSRQRKPGNGSQSVVQGYFNYHAVPGNSFSLARFRERVIRHWRSSLRRRSDKHRLSWSRFGRLAERWLPVQRILHPYPLLLRTTNP